MKLYHKYQEKAIVFSKKVGIKPYFL